MKRFHQKVLHQKMQKTTLCVLKIYLVYINKLNYFQYGTANCKKSLKDNLQQSFGK